MSTRLLFFLVPALAVPLAAFGQINTGPGTGAGGIRIDADGVVSMAIQSDQSPKLDKRRKAALAQQALPGDISVPSKQRMVSLVRLEAACIHLAAEKKPLPEEMKFLAGLTRLDHVFVDVDGHDVILAGPAEPFVQAESGRVIGLESGRPALKLDDLIVALRAVTPQAVVSCSIDPVPERLASFRKFIKENSFAAEAAVIQQRFRKMRELLGDHDVSFAGIPKDSHFAHGLLEADYRMKLLTLGLEKPAVKGFRSHLSIMTRADSMQRWWFVPLYDHIARSADGLAYEFAGQRAQLLGEDELVNALGERSKAPIAKITTQDYSRQFTAKFPQLAASMPVFAELQQLIDWAVFAALLRNERLAEKAGWTLTVFMDPADFPHEVWPVATQTHCVINTRNAAGGAIVAQLSGGVTIQPGDVLRHIAAAEGEELADRRTKAVTHEASAEHPWWWD